VHPGPCQPRVWDPSLPCGCVYFLCADSRAEPHARGATHREARRRASRDAGAWRAGGRVCAQGAIGIASSSRPTSGGRCRRQAAARASPELRPKPLSPPALAPPLKPAPRRPPTPPQSEFRPGTRAPMPALLAAAQIGRPSLLDHVRLLHGHRGGGVVSESKLLSRCLTTAPRESTRRRHWRSGPRARCPRL
jgi:hypothetical protein